MSLDNEVDWQIIGLSTLVNLSDEKFSSFHSFFINLVGFNPPDHHFDYNYTFYERKAKRLFVQIAEKSSKIGGKILFSNFQDIVQHLYSNYKGNNGTIDLTMYRTNFKEGRGGERNEY